MQHRRAGVVNCPHCGAENPSIESRCGSCSKGLTVYIGPAQNLPRRFGLGPLMVLVATIALGLAAFRPVPVLGTVILLLIPPAVVRTTAVVAQRAADGRPMSRDDTISVFVGSIGVMMLTLIAASLAFAAVCVPVGSVVVPLGGWGISYTLGLAVGAALLAAAWVLRRLWPHKG